VKNSKCFSTDEWQDESFLSPSQINGCHSLFQRNATQLSLSVIRLSQLGTNVIDPNLVETYLTPAERERLASFTFAKRHLEWLGGRIAAKKAALGLVVNRPYPPLTYQDLSVETHGTGRPFLHCRTNNSVILPEISISHSGTFAGCLAVTDQACGLDLQRVTAKVVTIRDYFASNSELALFLSPPHDLEESSALTLLWSAKEAFRKATSCQPLLGFTEITLHSLEGDLQSGMIGHFFCPRLTPSLLPAFLLLQNDYACAITISR
jgi:phosphopantetheinyl transferase